MKGASQLKGGLRRWPFGAHLLAFLVFSISPAYNRGQQSPHDANGAIDRIYLEAQEAQQRADYEGAAEKYAEILKLDPRALDARVNSGLMHHLQGKYAEAVHDFEIAISQQPRVFVANLFLGLDLLALQRPQSALAHLETARALHPKDLEPVLQLGRAFADLHEFNKANDWYRRATELNSASADAWYGLGITYLHLAREASEQLAKEGEGSLYARRLYAGSLQERGWTRDAITAYEKLLNSTSAPPCARADLGFAYLTQADENVLPKARNEFELARSGDPACFLARLGMARAALQGNDAATAWKELEEVWNADQRFVEINASLFWQGFDAATLEKVENTLRIFSPNTSDQSLSDWLFKSIEQSRNRGADTLNWIEEPGSEKPDAKQLASLPFGKRVTPAELYQQGHFTRCAQQLKAQLAGSSRDDLLLLANCSYDAGDDRLVLAAARQIQRRNPSNLAALYWKARSTQRLGVAALTRAALADPNSPRIHLLVAEAYREKGSYKEAEGEYSYSLQVQPDYVPAHLGLAMVYWQEHKYDQAIPHLRAALESKPGDPESSYVMGAILVDRHEFADAMPYLNSALSASNAILPHVHALRSKVYAAQGNVEAAVAEIKQSLGTDSHGAYHYQLYRLYKTLGNEQGAKGALEESERLRKQRNQTGNESVNGQP